MSWDRTVRRTMEVIGEDTCEVLHRLLLALGEHENGLDALDAALESSAAVQGERMTRLKGTHHLAEIERKAVMADYTAS